MLPRRLSCRFPAPRIASAVNVSGSSIQWSEGMISRMSSGSLARARNKSPARYCGQFLQECNALRDRVALQPCGRETRAGVMKSQARRRAIAAARFRVLANRLPMPGNSMNCFGRDFRLEGQRRVPDPPESTTGLIHAWTLSTKYN